MSWHYRGPKHGGDIAMAAQSRIGPIQALAGGVGAFIAIYAGVELIRVWMLTHLRVSGIHEIVEVRAFTSILLIWTTLGVVAVILRLRGQGLRDIGWGARATVWGWLLAIAVTIAYCAATLAAPMLKGAPILSDWSLFRIGTAIVVGLSAGICEESVFRGFVMTQARDAKLHWIVQIALSAVLFGLAHVGWGGLTGRLEIWPLIATMVSTAILGAMLAATYLVGGRSLMPVIAAHAAIDMVLEPWLLLYMVSGARVH